MCHLIVKPPTEVFQGKTVQPLPSNHVTKPHDIVVRRHLKGHDYRILNDLQRRLESLDLWTRSKESFPSSIPTTTSFNILRERTILNASLYETSTKLLETIRRRFV